MRVQLLTLMSAGALALTVPRDNGPAPLNDIPVFNTHTWPLLNPTQALSALHQKARATPAAVSFLPGVPIPSDVAKLVQNVEQVGESIASGLFEEVAKPHAAAHAETAETAEKVNLPQTPNKKVQGLEAATSAAECANPATHYEWRNLSDQHKQQFVAAIKCLMNTPARSGLAGTVTRWDDLAAIHQHSSPIIHNVGQFFGWHRYFVRIFEMELRNVCGYTGPMTWWDETKDAGNFNGSPLGTQQYFGHLPDGNAVCIISGQYANLGLRIGPGQSNTNHCLARGVNENLSAAITTNFVNTCWSYTNFADMQNCFFFGPHAYGHDAIGAVMSDVDSSPGDPLFFMHHGFIDRCWRIWQRMNPGARTYATGGYTTQNCGNNCQPTTLNYQLSSYGFYPSVPLSAVQDTEGTYLCYKYDY